MKTFLRIKPPLLMVVMLAITQMPAVAQVGATPRQQMQPTEFPLPTTTRGNVTLSNLDVQTTKPTLAAVQRPSAVDDAFTTDPGTLVAMPVLANDTDPQGLPLTVTAISTPAHGTATFNSTTVFYTPVSGFSGIDSLTYTVSNGVLTNTANVDAIVLPQPDLIWENDAFDPLNVGALAGQNGWTAVSSSASPLVINDTPPNKSVRIDAVPGLPINVTKDVADQTGGRHSFTFRVRVDGVTHIPCEAAIEMQTDFSNGWSNKFRYCIGPRIAVNYSSSGADTTIVTTTVPGQWYLIHTEIDLNTDLIDVYVDGLLKVSGLAVNTGPIRSLGITGQDPGGAGVVVVDNLTGVTANGITAGGGCGSGSGTPGMPNYWTGLGDSLWSNANNWSARRVPTATDHAIITLGGTYTVIVNSPVTVGSLTLGVGSGVQTLWVRNTTLTVNNDVRNSGFIRLESQVSNFASNLTIVNGLLTNNNVISVGLGSGGGRVITGQVCNRCRVDVHQDMAFNGTFYNRSIVDIDTTKQMSLTGTAQVFNQNSGEITGKGVLALSSSATLNFNRGATTGPNPPLLTGAKLNFGPAATGVATFIMQQSGVLSGDIGADQTVWIRDINGALTAANGFINAGVIRLESQTGGFSSSLNITSGTLTNTGVINVNQGAGGGRVITGTLANQGAVNVNLNLTFNGTFSNFNTLTIDSARTMTIAGNTYVFNQNAGTIAGDGVLTLSSSATMNFNSGATTGPNPPLLDIAKLNFGPAATGVATFIMQRSGVLSGDIGAEQTVWIRDINGALTAANGFINAGVIRLESQTSGFFSSLTITSGTLTNTGVINVNQGPGGNRFITGTLVNQGTVNVNLNLTFNGTFSNFNTLTIDSARTMTLAGNTYVFNQNAGTIAGDGVLTLSSGATMNFNSGATTGPNPPLLTGAKLNFGPAATGVATFIMQQSGVLSGDIGAEQTVWIRDINSGVTAANGFINAGVIRLESQTSGFFSSLTITSGTLTNTGVINVNQGPGGNRFITGTLANQGAVNVNYNLNFNGSFTNRDTLTIAGAQSLIAIGPLFRNDSSGVIRGSGTLNVQGTRFINAGEISPGAPPDNPGALTITGNNPQTATSVLSIEIGGTGVNEFDRLQVSGADTLNGTLNIRRINNYTPVPGNTFRILTYGSHSGVFSTVNGTDLGNGLRFKVNYNATNVTLEVAPEEAIAGLTATNNSPTPLGSVTTLTATVTAGSNVSYAWDFGDGTTGNGGVVTHTYPAAGNYSAIVTATNTLGSVTDTTIVNIFFLAPNLSATVFSFTPAAVIRGDPINLSGTVINNGTLPTAADFKVSCYLSSSPSVPDFSLLLTSFTLSALAAGQSNSFNQTGTVPANVAASGQYYVWVNVDADSTITESDETDNLLRAASQLTVTVPPTTAGIKPVTSSPRYPISAEFVVDIMVTDVTNLFGLSFELNYTNTAYIDVVTPTLSNVLPGPFMGNDVVFAFNVDETSGKIGIGVSRKLGQSGGSGSGVVASIRFKSSLSTPPDTQVELTLTNVSASDPSGAAILLPASSHTVTIYGQTVWPGDTNNDQIANQADVLPLGLHWSRTGLPRDRTTCEWNGHAALPWSPEAATYADANGDGVVNQADVLCIGLNWGKTHTALQAIADESEQSMLLSKTAAATIGTTFSGNSNPGEDFEVEVVIDQVVDLFGASFELLYAPATLLDPQATEAGSLMGNDVIFFPHVDKNAGQISIGVSRKAGQGGVTGKGAVAKIKMHVSSQAVRGQTITLTLQNVTANDPAGQALLLSIVPGSPVVVSVASPLNATLPTAFMLHQNSPNPFNPSTGIFYDLPEASEVRIEIFDMLGKRVRTLVNQRQIAGSYSVIWDSRDANGQTVASGVYLYQLRAGTFSQTRRMALLR